MNKIKELIELKEPYVHLAICDKENFRKLYLAYNDTRNTNIVVKFLEGNKCNTVNSLFSEFAKVMEFPEYFGRNWNAFHDCLNDLQWLPGDAYLLLIDDIDKLLAEEDEEDFKIFVKLIGSAVEVWTNGSPYKAVSPPPTPFHVVFQCSKDKENQVKKRFYSCGLKEVLSKFGLKDISVLNITE